MFGKLTICSVALVPSLVLASDICDIHLKGFVADRLESCLANHVLTTDSTYLSRVFCYQEDVGNWQTEFWGKFMHSAAPFWRLTGDARLKERMDESTRQIIAHQLPDGYIGNYAEGQRSDKGWDVWGNKYTMLGLLNYYDVTKDEKALKSAASLCDYLMTQFGPGKRDINRTGIWRGLPSCSVLEPVVGVYERTKGGKYLDFAAYIVGQMDDPDYSPRLIRDALAGVDVGDRVSDGTGDQFYVRSSRKAYEMMSCYQGLIAFARAAGRKDCLDAAVKAAESIARTEINVAGGGSCHENWYHGAKLQTRTHEFEQETCVVTTWLRLCGTLLAATGESRWADELEKTFYNAYLASLRRDGGAFLQYDPLAGHRHLGENHCRLHTNCCNANGPRGFLAFLESVLTAEGDEARVNLYSSGTVSIALPSGGERVVLEGYTEYPKFGEVFFRNRAEREQTFALAFRVPGWCENPSVAINGERQEGVRPGTYFRVRRTWKPGDRIDLSFPISVRTHEQDGYVAFTAGPIALARDVRFGDGPIDANVVTQRDRSGFDAAHPQLCPIRTDSGDMWITYAGLLTLGSHYKNDNERLPSVVKFCDYASAGNTWDSTSAYRVWLPTVLPLPERGGATEKGNSHQL